MERMQRPKVINFSDIRHELIAQLQIRALAIGISEPVTLIDGFVNQPFSMELSGSFVIGGPTIPMIMLLGNNSGRIYFFALKALLNNLEL